MSDERWHDLGPVENFTAQSLQEIRVEKARFALSCVDGRFHAISGVCNHVAGPLGKGRLDGDYVVCPWHNWKFHRATGLGEPGYEADAVPVHEVKIENGHLLLNLTPATKRTRAPHDPHPLARKPVREPGPIRVIGISTTVMDNANPRYSTSDDLLATAVRHAGEKLGAESRVINVRELTFRACEGYYSKSAPACTWPCSITQMDPTDQLDRVYEAIVHWADVVLIATPIRWGSASSLYYKMVERMNCIQNQVTIANKVLLKNKVAAFIITGGQDNIQAVAGQMLGFFTEIGCVVPQFPYIAHSRGWSAEDMERNTDYVQRSRELHEGAEALVTRAVDMAKTLLGNQVSEDRTPRGGRKAHQLDVIAQI